ncbi:MAG: hypothetical protein PHP79_00035 [Clostridia bacterium]|nr:hypothetical protein [Clostridia bacterium]
MKKCKSSGKFFGMNGSKKQTALKALGTAGILGSVIGLGILYLPLTELPSGWKNTDIRSEFP